MHHKVAATLASAVLALSQIPVVALADLTAANMNRDRSTFVKCGDAIDIMSRSADAFRDAVIACAASLRYYAHKADEQKTLDDTCLYRLYTGGSAERYGYVLSKSANRAGAKKAYAYGDEILKGVIAHCSADPNIVNAAKGILQSSATAR